MGHANLYDVLVAWAPTVAAIVAALLAYSARRHAIEAKTNAGEAAERARKAQELLQSKSEDG